MAADSGGCSPAHSHTTTVSPWVARFAGHVRPRGVVLDLACGAGRHARHFAVLGMQVEAVDRDVATLASLGGVPGIATRCADLEAGPWPYGGRAFDGIVVTNYLHRPLLPLLAAALAPGGVLIYETFRLGNESYGKPSNPAFLLRSGELLEFAQSAQLSVTAYEDGFVAVPKPALVQRICAFKGPVFPPERGRLE